MGILARQGNKSATVLSHRLMSTTNRQGEKLSSASQFSNQFRARSHWRPEAVLRCAPEDFSIPASNAATRRLNLVYSLPIDVLNI